MECYVKLAKLVLSDDDKYVITPCKTRAYMTNICEGLMSRQHDENIKTIIDDMMKLAPSGDSAEFNIRSDRYGGDIHVFIVRYPADNDVFVELYVGELRK